MSSLVPPASISHNCLEPQRVCSTLKSPVTEKFFECLKSQFKPWRTTNRGDGDLAGLDTGLVALAKFGFANVGNKRCYPTSPCSGSWMFVFVLVLPQTDIKSQ